AGVRAGRAGRRASVAARMITATAKKAGSIWLRAFASLIGTTIQWYDFFLSGTAAALVFNRLYFPTFDPLTGTLAAFGTYAVGFVARPIRGSARRHPRGAGRRAAAL